MKIELHSHTNYSRGTKILYDGIETPEVMVRRAKQLGLGALAITDHDTMAGIKDAKAVAKKHKIIIIPGEEVSSKHGHVIALGISETIRPGLGVFETVDLIHSQGGIAIAVHPFDIKHDGLREYSKACDAIEIFNGNNVDRISNIRARNFARRTGMTMTAGSDAHTAAMLGSGLIRTNAQNVDDVIKSIKKNNFKYEFEYPSAMVLMDFAVRRLKMSYDYTAKYMDENYNPTKKYIGKKMLGLVKKSPGGIDNFFKLLTYLTLASTVTYSLWKNGIRK